jgi:copper chaperone NosL
MPIFPFRNPQSWIVVNAPRPYPNGWLWVLVGLATCADGPRPLAYGHEACAFCRMTLTDVRYGAEVLTTKGKVYPFDSIECMASFYQTLPPENGKGIYVVDFEHPGVWVPAEQARYVRSEQLPSPMGLHLTAFAPDHAPEHLQATYGGEVLTWGGIQQFVQARPLR